MKIFFMLLCLFTLNAQAEDPKAYIGSFDSKVYSLKSKGIKDFVVDVESSKLTKQMNDQMVFGKVKNLTFRVFWTASPERIAVDVLGLPEGFKEIKDELKLSLLSAMDNLIPLSVQDKFLGYKITAGAAPKEFVAKDQSGVAQIPTYVLKFDARDTLTEVTGKKAVGTFKVTSKYDKESFSDGKWVLKEQVTTSEENGQSMVSTKELGYGDANGVGVLEEVKIEVVQKWETPESKPLKIEDTLEFKNYKINTGEGLKYFLGDAVK